MTYRERVVVFMAVLTMACTVSFGQTPVGEWTFDDPEKLTHATTGSDLQPVGSQGPTSGFTEADGAVNVPRGSHYVCQHGLSANGGGNRVNEFSLVFDFKLPSVGSWYSFYNTNVANSNDGDGFVNPSGHVGVGATGYSSKTLSAQRWYRLVISVDLGGAGVTYYLDGTRIQNGTGSGVDGRFSLNPVGSSSPSILLLADENGEDNDIDVSYMAIYDSTLTSTQAAGLGGPGGSTDPVPTATPEPTPVVDPELAKNWPTYQHDNQRSGISPVQLELPLNPDWVLVPRQRQHAAWEASPAKDDPWHNFRNLKPRSLFDRANYVSVMDSLLFFGSSADDMVCCVDAKTGEERWVYFTEGPVRLAPTVSQGRVVFGSDDGTVYCLKAEDGTLIWKYKPSPGNDRIIGNGRMISTCPVRTSVLVQGNTVYFCAGIFPQEGVYMCALEVETGAVTWKKQLSISPQGYLLATMSRLYVPTGNTDPRVFLCSDGSSVGKLGSGRSGGTYALIAGNRFVAGPAYSGSGTDLLLAYDTNTTDHLAYVHGNHIIVTESVSYLHSDTGLSALDRAAYFKAAEKEIALKNRREKIKEEVQKLRKKPDDAKLDALSDELETIKTDMDASLRAKKASVLWSVECGHPHSLIVAGTTLFAGGEGEVAAYSQADGALLWTGEVMGGAHGLAVASESLYVSTDQGTIHRFGRETGVTQWHTY